MSGSGSVFTRCSPTRISGRRGFVSWLPRSSSNPEAVERFLSRAERLGRVARVADNRFFLPETLASLAEIARELADSSPEGTFTAATFKERCGLGRNVTIQILEYLDKVGATRRTGDTRIVLRGSDVFA